MKGDCLFESIGLSLTLVVLIFSLVAGITNAYYPGPDYDDEFAIKILGIGQIDLLSGPTYLLVT